MRSAISKSPASAVATTTRRRPVDTRSSATSLFPDAAPPVTSVIREAIYSVSGAHLGQASRAETIAKSRRDAVHLAIADRHRAAPAPISAALERFAARIALFDDRAARHGTLKFDTGLCLDAKTKRMFHLLHLRHQIGALQQRFVLPS